MIEKLNRGTNSRGSEQFGQVRGGTVWSGERKSAHLEKNRYGHKERQTYDLSEGYISKGLFGPLIIMIIVEKIIFNFCLIVTIMKYFTKHI